MSNSTSTIVSVYGLSTSKNFENKLSATINDHLAYYKLEAVSDIYVSDAGMKLASGYGQYKKYVTIEIDGESFDLKLHSTDSESYDFYNNSDVNDVTKSNALKNLIIEVLEEKLEIIEERIQEIREEEE